MRKKDLKSLQAKILTGFQCNNACLFCYDRRYRFLPMKSTGLIKEEIKKAYKLGFRKIHLIGGEITIRNDLLELIRYAKKAGFSYIMLTSNGRMFAYPDFAQRIVDAGISQIVFSLHGNNAKLHDSLTNTPGSFGQIISGIRNLIEIGFSNIGTNTTILKQNFRHLPEITKLLGSFAIERAEFIWVGTELSLFKEFTPRIRDAAFYLQSLLNYTIKRNYDWILQNVPIWCYFKGYFKYLSAAGAEGNCVAIHNRLSCLYQKTDLDKKIHRIKIEKCLQCSISAECPGIWDTYLNIYGPSEVIPIK